MLPMMPPHTMPVSPTGHHPQPASPAPAAATTPSESVSDLVPSADDTARLRPLVIDALRTVFDPEIPVNIYELGLIYEVIVDAGAHVGVRMTLTAPACPAAQTLPVEVREKASRVAGVASARVEVVWEPPWTRDRMSDAAKLQLGMF